MKLQTSRFAFIAAAISTSCWAVFRISQEVFIPSQPGMSKMYAVGEWPIGQSFIKLFSIFLISVAVAWLIAIILNSLLNKGRAKR